MQSESFCEEEGHEASAKVIEGNDVVTVTPIDVSSNGESQFFQYGEDEFSCFPRCEYRARFHGTTAFNMTTPDVWNTYFRSTPALFNTDRVFTLMRDKYVFNGRFRERFPQIKAGTFASPFSLVEYRRMFPKSASKIRKTKPKPNEFNFYIYDDMLQYKLEICEIVIQRYREKIKNKTEHIKLFFENIYPCIQVQVMPIENANLKSDEEFSSFYEIVFTYFTAITNAIAYGKGIPTEMVSRASFCFSIPCVSKAIHSFRISVGIVSKVYAEKVLVESLLQFNEKFPKFLNSKLGPTPELSAINDSICHYNRNAEEKYKLSDKNLQTKQTETSKSPKTVDAWSEEDTVFSLLLKTGDSLGNIVLCRMTARRKFVELLGNYVHEELIKNWENPNLVAPFKRLLLQLEFKDDVIVNVRNESDYNAKKFSFKEETDKEIQYDDTFWEMMRKICMIFVKNDIYYLCDAVENRKMLGIYSLIERANVEFIRNSSDQNDVQDEYGSDSDCEFTVTDCGSKESIFGFCKKITVATGMRAISLAHFIAIYRAGVKRIDTEFMYYETECSLDFINKIVPKLNLKHFGTYQETVRYIDLNYCNADGKMEQLDLNEQLEKMLVNGENEIVIFDYTTATTDRMNAAIRLFIPHVKIILLVNSGLKNEQIGADVNTHGMLRIITKDVKILNHLYYGLKTVLSKSEEMPKQVHDIRRAYKSVGAAVTNEAIFKKHNSYFQSKNNQNFVD